MWELSKMGKTEQNNFPVNTEIYVLYNICVAPK